MNFIDLATERYSVRKFTDKPLEKEIIDRILKAGHVAPTGCNYLLLGFLLSTARKPLQS